MPPLSHLPTGGSALRGNLDPYRQENFRPVFSQAQSNVQAHEARLRQEYQERLTQQELLRRYHEHGGRELQVRLPRHVQQGQQGQQLRQSQGRVKQERVIRRFPGRLEKAKQFLALINSSVPTRGLLPDVANMFRTAPELVRDFQVSAGAIDQIRFPQPVPQPQQQIDIPPDKRASKPHALSCELLEHQKVGLTWLMQQEDDPNKRGGILADTMGLGKTIQALALILARPGKPSRKTTLIVAPLSLLRQWEREIQEKVKPRAKLKTLIYHGPKAKRNMTVAKLLTNDIVLTTYRMIVAEDSSRNGKARIILGEGALFHRVILDEAHNVKNKSAKGLTAVSKIKSTYRLCMTGTPFMNNTEEIFPLIHFLRIRPYDQWEAYNRKIHAPIKSGHGDLYDDAMKRLRELFRYTTLRRTKESTLDGKPIIVLPGLIRKVVPVEFTVGQRNFYDALERRQQLKVNDFIKANGSLMRRYTYILVLLLRLRQACCHPHLIKDFGIPEGAELTSDEMRKLAHQLEKGVVERLKAQVEFECPLCSEVTENPLIISPCGHMMCSACFSTTMETTDQDAEGPIPCLEQGCGVEIHSKNVICYCFFKEVHMPDNVDSDSSEDENSDDDSDGFESLPDDYEDEVDARGNLKGFIASSDEEEEYDSDNGEPEEDSDDESLLSYEEISRRVDVRKSISEEKSVKPSKRESTSNSISDGDLSENEAPSSKGKRKRSSSKGPQSARKKSKMNNGTSGKLRKSKGKGKTKKFTSLAELKKASSTNAAAKEKFLKRLRKHYVASAKINKLMEILRDIKEQKPREKTLVFSLWTSFLDLIEIPMQDEGYRYVRYDGSMRQEDRDAVVQKFMDSDVQVMLVSLSAGNAGLNLTAASHVILLEPFWNPFIEEQAIDRTHRIGQKKVVTVYRVLIAGTVEDRICLLQDKKRNLVHAALGEEGAKGASRMTEAQLMGLFGLQ
ncbi:hypothetical protein F5Y13DRAFT_202377 [Hypoxylon sp. FL1857]|nr:hypothetical protein F5Y13DRAFT_202377 [Hypoxylon sp. FL1857]